MIILQEAMAAGPFLFVFLLLAVASVGVLFYSLFRIYKLSNKQVANAAERTDKVIAISTHIVLSLAIFIGLFLTLGWLRNIHFD